MQDRTLTLFRGGEVGQLIKWLWWVLVVCGQRQGNGKCIQLSHKHDGLWQECQEWSCKRGTTITRNKCVNFRSLSVVVYNHIAEKNHLIRIRTSMLCKIPAN